MRKWHASFIGICFFLSLGIPAFAYEKKELPALVKDIVPSTVVIFTYDKDGEIIKQGSGFFVTKDGDIITNRHVFAGAHRAEIKTFEGKVFPITHIVAENTEADIVQTRVAISTPVSPLSLSSSVPEVGEKIMVVGNPLGLEQTVSDGIVSAIRDIPEFGKTYQITAPISPGSSGSPVVNMKGEVIGVASFQFAEGQNLNFAIPSEHITLEPGKGKTLKEWSASAQGLYSIGLLFLWIDDYEKAISYFQKAVEKDPNYADAHFQIGYCYAELGRYIEAVESYKQAIRLKPDYAEAHYNLGLTYLILGNRSSALDEYKILKELDINLANKLFNLIYE